MKKWWWLAALLQLGIAVTVGCFVFNLIHSADQKMIKKVGNSYIIKKDTVVVTDYSLLFSNYKLDNGTEVSTEYLNTLKQLEHENTN